MDIFKFFRNLFSKEKEPVYPERGTGLIRDPEDGRDVILGSFQKPVGAPSASSDEFEKILLALPSFDQYVQPACVAHGYVKMLIAYLYRKTGKLIKLSPRFLYKLCKMYDGIPTVKGTYPRVGGLMLKKFGVCLEEFLQNDTTLSESDYLGIQLIQTMFLNAEEFKIPGFAIFDARVKEELKEAIHQNGMVALSMCVGDWSVLPLRKGDGRFWHFVIAYKYEEVGGRLKVYLDNSWGPGWLSWILNWLFPGKGYFWFDEYQVGGLDTGVVVTEIPTDYLDYVKSTPYRFTKMMGVGTNDPQVKYLQKMLNEKPQTKVSDLGAGSPGHETEYFGLATKAALVKWQQMNGISPTSGYFGSISMAKANERMPKMTLEQALILQESGGNDNAVGDKNLTNHAYGCLQIRKPCMDDVNKRLGTTHRAEECLGNRDLSLLVFRTYTSIYEPTGTDEEKARLWNAGPNWRLKRSSTDAYWTSVKNKLNK